MIDKASYSLNHILEVVIIPNLNLLDFVRGTEAVKEMKERNG